MAKGEKEAINVHIFCVMLLMLMIKSHGNATYCHGNLLFDFCGNPVTYLNVNFLKFCSTTLIFFYKIFIETDLRLVNE